MKRRRRWFWVVGSLLFLLTLYLSNEIWDVVGVNERIRRLVVARLRLVLGPDSDIGEVQFGLSQLVFRNVSLQFKGSPIALTIPELELRYGVRSLLRGGFRPERSTDRVIFRRPRLTFWKQSQDTTTHLNLSLELSQEMESRYRELLREYAFIRSVVIEDGEIAFIDTASGIELPTIREIVGLLETSPDGKAMAQLSGKLFESSNVNAYLRAGVDFGRGGLDSLAVIIDGYDLRDGIPVLVPAYVGLEGGRLTGRLNVFENRYGPGFDVAGTLQLSDGRFRLADGKIRVTDAGMAIELRDGDLHIREAFQKVNGSPVAFSGAIRNVFQPEFDLRLEATDLELGAFLRQWAPDAEVPVEGRAQLSLRLTEAVDRPVIDGRVRIPQLQIGKATFEELSGSVRVSNEQLQVTQLTGSLADSMGRFSGGGVLRLSEPATPIEFDLAASGEFAPMLRSFGVQNVKSCAGRLDLHVGGSVSHPIGDGQLDLVWTNPSGDAFPLAGNVRYESGGVSVQAESPQRGFRIDAAIANVWRNPLLKVQANNVESTFILLNERLLTAAREHLALDVFLQGRRDRINFLVEGFSKPSRRKLVQLFGSSELEEGGGRRLEGTVTFYPQIGKELQGRFEAMQTENRFELLQIEASPYVSGSLTADLTPGGEIAGSLKIAGLPLTELLETRYIKGKPAHRGDLYGSVLFGGPTSAPRVIGNFWLLKGVYNGVGEFEAELSFELDRQGVNVAKWALTRGGAPYLTGSLHYLFGSQEVDAEVFGEDINAQDFLQLLSGRSGFYDGTATIQLRAKGQGPRVPLYGSIEIHDGHLMDLRFDRMALRFGQDPDQPTSSYLGEGYLRSEEITVSRTGAFTLVGYGALPLVENKELDLHLSGDGNFTPLLSDLSDLFRPSDVRAHLSLNVFGGYLSPKFSNSRLEIVEGTLRLSAVAPEIKNLRGTLSISADGDFLAVEELTGTIGGKPLTVLNRRNPVGVNHGAQVPLRLGGDGLSLGTLLVRTRPEGVRLNIPAVMAEGEYGWFSVSGREKDEDFYIAGPWRRPLVRGEVQLRDVNVMYPFEEDDSEPNPVVQNILYNINWNVRVVSRQDTRYVREIPAASMYLNVKMDDRFSALDFTGVWRDSTFRIEGHLEATQGIIEYLNHVFRIEWFTADFDPSDLFPVVSGRAWTVIEDTTRTPANVYLTLYTVDELTQEEIQRGRWEQIRVKITSDRPTYLSSQRDVLSTLGYSWDTMDQVIEKGVEVAGVAADYQTLGRMLRPFERRLERTFKLDVVHFSSRLTQNILELSRLGLLSPSLSLLRSSRLMLGKYLPGDLYFTYTGQLESGLAYQLGAPNVTYGLRHALDLRYRLNPQIFLEMEYNYNNLYLVDKDDARVWFRWSFPLWDKK